MHENFKFDQRLSLTSTSSVYAGIHLRSNKQRAVKCINREVFEETGRDIEVPHANIAESFREIISDSFEAQSLRHLQILRCI